MKRGVWGRDRIGGASKMIKYDKDSAAVREAAEVIKARLENNFSVDELFISREFALGVHNRFNSTEGRASQMDTTEKGLYIVRIGRSDYASL